MKVAKIIDNNISISNVYELYPHVSFPDIGVPDSFLQQNDLYKVVEFLPHDEATQNYHLLPTPIIEDNIVYTVAVTPKTNEEIREYKLMKIRGRRNEFLNASDIDVTIDKWENYTEDYKTALRNYRQALRDLPQTIEDFNNINWPTKPSVNNNNR